MRKLVIEVTGAVALLLAGILAWNAEATPLTGATTVRLGTKYSLVEKAGCSEADQCPMGQEVWGTQKDPIQCVSCTPLKFNMACPSGKTPRYILAPLVGA